MNIDNKGKVITFTLQTIIRGRIKKYLVSGNLKRKTHENRKREFKIIKTKVIIYKFTPNKDINYKF